MRKFVLYLVWGWFFLSQAPFEKEAVIVSKIGPFKTEAECKARHAEVKDMLEALPVPGAKMSPCFYSQET
jgi:hypothetical protein